jgi:3-methylcrotonyl-CoA carboxylase alpha subunit
VPVTAHYRPHGYLLDLPDGSRSVSGEVDADGAIAVEIDGARMLAQVVRRGTELTVFARGRSHRLELAVTDATHEAGDEGSLVSPMPGSVIDVLVKVGDSVVKGAPLMLIEAMKMEHTIAAPADGVVKEVFFAKGDQVREGVELLAFEGR